MASQEPVRVPLVMVGDGAGSLCESGGAMHVFENVVLTVSSQVPALPPTPSSSSTSAPESCSPDSCHGVISHNNNDCKGSLLGPLALDVNIGLEQSGPDSMEIVTDKHVEAMETSDSESPDPHPATTTVDHAFLELSDTKEGIDDLCPVCGDKVSGYHYGLLTCESCKGFFKRTVQNKKVYTCVSDNSCPIDKTQRKRCPYCRFQKCLTVGMRLEAVREDRMRGGRNKFGPMYKRDRARKMEMLRRRNVTAPSPSRGSSGAAMTFALNPNVQIKEEIQSPFLSSSTSSPESSPSPMPGVAPQQGSAMLGSSEACLCPNSAVSTRVPPLIRQLVTLVDDDDWQHMVYSILQDQTYNQCEVDLFELMCKVLEHNLFAQVDWARNSFFFKDLRLEDQMKLLHHSWSDMLMLDHLRQRIHKKLQDDMQLPNGQKFDLVSLALLGTKQHADRLQHVLCKLVDLKFDIVDYICIKISILLNPEVRNLIDRQNVQVSHDQVKQAHAEYCLAVYSDDPDRYQKLMEVLPEIHAITDHSERHLYSRHVNSNTPPQTLLLEMLYTKRR